MVKLRTVRVPLPDYAGVHGDPVHYSVWLYRDQRAAKLEVGDPEFETFPLEPLCAFDPASDHALVDCVDTLIGLGGHPDLTVEFRMFWHYDNILKSEIPHATLDWFSKSRSQAAA